ncbi:MAG: fasciclin domain-containing protein [Ilumatobacteraceae bacterium]
MTHPRTLRRSALTGMLALSATLSLSTVSPASATTTPSSDPMHSMAPMAPAGPGCAAVPADGAGSFGGMAQDPAATAASNNPLLSTLVSAVKQAGLVDTLNGPGPFTIFAPTNDAFAKIPAADLQAVLADQDQLTSILTYHVVPGMMSSADLVKAGTATTVNGAELQFSRAADGQLLVNGSPSVCMDVPTANATVHIVDTVLMPGVLATSGPGCASIPTDGAGSFGGMAQDPAATAASNNPLLSTLVSAVKQAGLVDTLNGPGPFTIFAPTNDAFAKIPAADLQAVLADQDQLTSILTYHVVPGMMSSADLVKAGTATTVNGATLSFTRGPSGELMVNGATVAACMDVVTANATVHIIDSVLMPPAG